MQAQRARHEPHDKGSRLPHGTCAVCVFFLDGNFHDFVKGLLPLCLGPLDMEKGASPDIKSDQRPAQQCLT
jgi:hypothetical protein